jgi:hypothetical protein
MAIGRVTQHIEKPLADLTDCRGGLETWPDRPANFEFIVDKVISGGLQIARLLTPLQKAAGIERGLESGWIPQATLIAGRRFAFGLTLMFTSWPSALRKRATRSAARG